MTEQTPKRRRKSKAVSEEISTETVSDSTADEKYRASEPKKYQPPEGMVPVGSDRYLKKDRVGTQKTVRGPGHQVSRVGIGGLNVIHQNSIDYHGNIDLRSDTSGST